MNAISFHLQHGEKSMVTARKRRRIWEIIELAKAHKIIDNNQKFSLTEISYAMKSLRKDEIVGKGVVVIP